MRPYNLFIVRIWIENAIISKHMFPMFSKQHCRNDEHIHIQCVTNTSSHQIQKQSFSCAQSSVVRFINVLSLSLILCICASRVLLFVVLFFFLGLVLFATVRGIGNAFVFDYSLLLYINRSVFVVCVLVSLSLYMSP